jgi:hypothetical protein
MRNSVNVPSMITGPFATEVFVADGIEILTAAGWDSSLFAQVTSPIMSPTNEKKPKFRLPI